MKVELVVTWSAIISSISLFASFASPLLTAAIKNRHELKMYNLGFFVQHRAEAIERYIASVGAVIHGSCDEDLREYGTHLGEIYLYVPERLWLQIEQIDLAIRAKQRENAADRLFDLCQELSKEHPRPIKQGCYGKKKQGIK